MIRPHNAQGHRAAASDLELQKTRRRRLRRTVLFAGFFSMVLTDEQIHHHYKQFGIDVSGNLDILRQFIDGMPKTENGDGQPLDVGKMFQIIMDAVWKGSPQEPISSIRARLMGELSDSDRAKLIRHVCETYWNRDAA